MCRNCRYPECQECKEHDPCSVCPICGEKYCDAKCYTSHVEKETNENEKIIENIKIMLTGHCRQTRDKIVTLLESIIDLDDNIQQTY